MSIKITILICVIAFVDATHEPSAPSLKRLVDVTRGQVAPQVDRITRSHQSLAHELSTSDLLSSSRSLKPHSIGKRRKREVANFIKDETTGKVYHYDSSIGTYDDSVEYCAKLNGVLTSIATEGDALFLVKIVGRFRDIWLGSTKSTQSGGQYSWLDKSPFNKELWKIAPSTDADYALSLTSYPDTYGQIREVPSDRTYRRICLMNAIPVSTVAPTTRDFTYPPRITTEMVHTTTRGTEWPSTPVPTFAPTTRVFTYPPETITEMVHTTTRGTEATPTPTPFSSPAPSPSSRVEEKLDKIVDRLERQENLFRGLIRALKNAFNAV